MEHKLIDYHSIGPNFKIKGDLTIKGETLLFGDLEGNVSIEDQSLFVLEDTGRIIGNFTGGDIIIRGYFEGEILSTGKVSVLSSANIIGKIQSKSLEISPGAQLQLKIS